MKDYKLNLLLWLLIAVNLSGFSYWLLSGPGVVLGSGSAIPSLQRLKVSFIRSSMYPVGLQVFPTLQTVAEKIYTFRTYCTLG